MALRDSDISLLSVLVLRDQKGTGDQPLPEAFWVGGMGVYFVALSVFLAVALTLEINALSINILGGLIISFGFILIFLWIDSTVSIARRSDPLFRDTLRWSKLRYLFWLVTIGGAVGALFTSINSGFSTVAGFGVLRGGRFAVEREEVWRYDLETPLDMDRALHIPLVAEQPARAAAVVPLC